MLENRPHNLSNKGTSGFMKFQALVRVTNQGYCIATAYDCLKDIRRKVVNFRIGLREVKSKSGKQKTVKQRTVAI
jgi:hypothetical protein